MIKRSDTAAAQLVGRDCVEMAHGRLSLVCRFSSIQLCKVVVEFSVKSRGGCIATRLPRIVDEMSDEMTLVSCYDAIGSCPARNLKVIVEERICIAANHASYGRAKVCWPRCGRPNRPRNDCSDGKPDETQQRASLHRRQNRLRGRLARRSATAKSERKDVGDDGPSRETAREDGPLSSLRHGKAAKAPSPVDATGSTCHRGVRSIPCGHRRLGGWSGLGWWKPLSSDQSVDP